MPFYPQNSGGKNAIRQCICLSTEDLHALIDGLEALLTGRCANTTEDELSVKLPAGGQLPLARNALVDQRVVVLKVGTEALELEGSPGKVLLDGVALGSPTVELLSVGLELVLVLMDSVLVVEEEDSAGGALEHVHLVGGALPAVGGDNGLEGLGGNVP